MSDEPKSNVTLLQELRKTQGEIARLIEHIEGGEPQSLPGGSLPEKRKAESVRVFIARTKSTRRSFAMRIDGPVAYFGRLSAIRTAVFLALLTDLQERLEGGPGEDDLISRVVRLKLMLDSDLTSMENQVEAARVALYRFKQFCEEENYFTSTRARLFFDAESLMLRLQTPDGATLHRPAAIHIESDDAVIESWLNDLFNLTPLAKAKKHQSLFVPAGLEGYERLLLEMLNHPYPLSISTVYFQLATISYPGTLLEFVNAPEALKLRRKLAIDGYQTGRFTFHEIIHFDTFWNLIRSGPNGGFRLYPRTVPQALIEEQLITLHYQVQHYDSYHLILTGAPAGSCIGTCEIRDPGGTEYYTYFPWLGGTDYAHDVSCFVLTDPRLHRSVHDNILNWLLRHPSTVTDRSEIIRLISTALERLKTAGPLAESEDAPSVSGGRLPVVT